MSTTSWFLRVFEMFTGTELVKDVLFVWDQSVHHNVHVGWSYGFS
jgi:hypothetical protein